MFFFRNIKSRNLLLSPWISLFSLGPLYLSRTFLLFITLPLYIPHFRFVLKSPNFFYPSRHPSISHASPNLQAASAWFFLCLSYMFFFFRMSRSLSPALPIILKTHFGISCTLHIKSWSLLLSPWISLYSLGPLYLSRIFLQLTLSRTFHFRFVSTIPTFSLSRRTFFYSSCISQSSNRICLNFTVSSTDLLIFIRMSHFRFSCTFPGVHLFAGTFLYLLQISLYLHIFLYILYLPRISLFLS